jgi:hypothetical protein
VDDVRQTFINYVIDIYKKKVAPMVEGMQRKTLASQYQVKKVESSLKKALVIGFNLKASNSSKKSGSRMKH